MTANCVTQTLKDHSLLTKSATFSGDNTNTNLGGINRSENKNVIKTLKHELKKELVGATCPVHILQNCIQYGAHILSADIECIIMKIYNYFPIYSKNR
jgi:hypothetical protein